MWRYPGPSYPNRSFSVELAGAKVDFLVRRILGLDAHRHSSSGPIPFRDGVVRPWVSTLGPISTRLCQFLAFLILDACVCSDPPGLTLAEDVAR
jgi:hypothetical protein